MDKGAIFSECGKYRFSLWRIWDNTKPILAFIGLNPSTANSETNDPTIRRVIKFAKDNGYGGIKMLNLFTIISALPSVLLTHPNPLQEADNILSDIPQGQDVVLAWGAFPEAIERGKMVIQRFPNAFCLGKNKDGSPKHPLYVKANQPLIPFIEGI